MTKFFSWDRLIKDKRVKFIFFLSIVIFIYLYLKNTGQDFTEITKINRPIYLLIAFPVILMSLYLHGFAWYKILNLLGSKISVTASIYLYYSSALGRYVPGSFWYVLLRSAIGYDLGISPETSMVGVGFELLLTISSGIAVIVIGLVFGKLTFTDDQVTPLLWFTGISLILLTLIVILSKIFASKGESSSPKTSAISLLPQAINKIRTLPKKELLHLFILFFTTWFSQGTAFFLLTQAWNSLSTSTLLTFIAVYASGWLIGFINPLTPNGIGSRETLFLLALPNLLSPPIILATSIMMRLLGIIGEFLFALIFWLLVRINPKQNDTITPV
ncbi:MAG: lysylphosphatidylglycerol synthase domain-containing protein [Anaerolineaceae bacterium]